MNGRAFAILASGNGSNALALHAAVREGRIDAPLACIVSDQPSAPVVDRARAAGAISVVVDRSSFPDRDTYEHALVGELIDRGVRHVVLAGYMRVCGPTFLDAFDTRTINIHPSLLPEFPGRDAIGDAIAAGVERTGISVHFIDDGVDTGPLICRAPLSVHPGEMREQLQSRIHELEHGVLPVVVAGLVRGEITLGPSGVAIHRARAALLRDAGAEPVLASSMTAATMEVP